MSWLRGWLHSQLHSQLLRDALSLARPASRSQLHSQLHYLFSGALRAPVDDVFRTHASLKAVCRTAIPSGRKHFYDPCRTPSNSCASLRTLPGAGEATYSPAVFFVRKPGDPRGSGGPASTQAIRSFVPGPLSPSLSLPRYAPPRNGGRPVLPQGFCSDGPLLFFRRCD